MAVSIGSFDITVPGQIVRKYNTDEDVTTLRFDEDQVRALDGDITKIMSIIAQPPTKTKDDEPELPLGK